jgi:hypothetical protein
MWPQLLQRSVQCSRPVPEGAMRCTVVAAEQRWHRGLDEIGALMRLFEQTFLIFREIAKI